MRWSRTVWRPSMFFVSPSDHLETAATLMLEHKVGGLPVMENDSLLGIITESDLFRVFVQLKHESKAIRLTLHAAPRPEPLADPGRLALACGLQVRELLTHSAPEGGTLVMVRVLGERVDEYVNRLSSGGYLLIGRADSTCPQVLTDAGYHVGRLEKDPY